MLSPRYPSISLLHQSPAKHVTMSNPANDRVDQQLSSHLFHLPAELRHQIYGDVTPAEVVLEEPAGAHRFRHDYSVKVGGIMFSCKRVLHEFSSMPLPRMHLKMPSLDADTNTALESFPSPLLSTIKSITIKSPNWVVRPDRFQWSSDQATLKFDVVNRFLDKCIGMELLLIEVSGQSFSGLVNATLRQLEPLKVREGVEVDIQVSKGSIPNRAMGPSPDTITKVKAAIKGDVSLGTEQVLQG